MGRLDMGQSRSLPKRKSNDIVSRTVSVIAAYCSNIIQLIFVNKLHYSVTVNYILLRWLVG